MRPRTGNSPESAGQRFDWVALGLLMCLLAEQWPRVPRMEWRYRAAASMAYSSLFFLAPSFIYQRGSNGSGVRDVLRAVGR
ncbi:hypothetical protein GE21DRAFT_1281753 [Neurospora crassa]|nr:hypothetical protein GE21DRAFT_1281753 [Neurospora crassa]